jgi:hypothetical protein
MGILLQHLALAALVLAMLAVASSDLGIDVLRVSPAALPRWQRNLTLMLVARQAAEMRPVRWVRRVGDCVVIAFAYIPPVFIWLPGRYPDLGVRAIWALYVAASLGWFLHLFRLRRR